MSDRRIGQAIAGGLLAAAAGGLALGWWRHGHSGRWPAGGWDLHLRPPPPT